jgi:hypothetical protein
MAAYTGCHPAWRSDLRNRMAEGTVGFLNELMARMQLLSDTWRYQSQKQANKRKQSLQQWAHLNPLTCLGFGLGRRRGGGRRGSWWRILSFGDYGEIGWNRRLHWSCLDCWSNRNRWHLCSSRYCRLLFLGIVHLSHGPLQFFIHIHNASKRDAWSKSK